MAMTTEDREKVYAEIENLLRILALDARERGPDATEVYWLYFERGTATKPTPDELKEHPSASLHVQTKARVLWPQSTTVKFQMLCNFLTAIVKQDDGMQMLMMAIAQLPDVHHVELEPAKATGAAGKGKPPKYVH